MARTLAVTLLCALMPLCWAATARAADCTPDQADKLFHPYGEPSPCAVDTNLPAPKEDEKPAIFADERGQRKLYTLGLSGIEGGATVAGLGGFFYLTAQFLDNGRDGKPTSAKNTLHWGGIGIAAVGGAMFVTGAVLLIADYITAPVPTPTPTPDGKGMQLSLSLRW